MILQRRGFLSAILLAGTAPAIVRASSLMKIIAPVQNIVVSHTGRGMTQSLYTIDELGWIERDYINTWKESEGFDQDKAIESIRELRNKLNYYPW